MHIIYIYIYLYRYIYYISVAIVIITIVITLINIIFITTVTISIIIVIISMIVITTIIIMFCCYYCYVLSLFLLLLCSAIIVTIIIVIIVIIIIVIFIIIIIIHLLLSCIISIVYIPDRQVELCAALISPLWGSKEPTPTTMPSETLSMMSGFPALLKLRWKCWRLTLLTRCQAPTLPIPMMRFPLIPMSLVCESQVQRSCGSLSLWFLPRQPVEMIVCIRFHLIESSGKEKHVRSNF